MNRLTDETELQRIFCEIGKDYGFEQVTAAFSPEYDLKVAWRRMGSWIDFWISDYLRNAPEDVLESLARMIYGRIRDYGKTPYSDELIEYVTDRGFIEENREMFLSRICGISPGPMGRHVDLTGSYIRLLDRGLVEPEEDLVLRWSALTDNDMTGRSSALMKTVCMNRRLDS